MIHPDYLRDELSDGAELYDLTQEEADFLSSLDDGILEETIMSCADDGFWEILDMIRGQAIRVLAAEHLTTSR